MGKELDDAVYEKIVRHTDAGNRILDENGSYASAMSEYEKALALLPKPVSQWEAALWIYTALGDCCFLTQQIEAALAHMRSAVLCPGGLGNAFVHLRMGQCLFEQGQLPKAADELARAYMGAGIDIFSEEDEKYLTFLRTKMRGI
jgi:tetratricopeptide (TPR) repeat protein